jgi:hypothetical protein
MISRGDTTFAFTADCPGKEHDRRFALSVRGSTPGLEGLGVTLEFDILDVNDIENK